jgi:threonine dehydrogenase-like Zn-dependent dehydrogenase
MRALRKLAPAPGLSLTDVEPPKPGPDEVLIEVVAAGICGSDLHLDDWSPSYHFTTAALPVTLGHEFSGTVVELGESVDAAVLPVGRQALVMPSVICGQCPACLSGAFDDCVTRKGIGMTRDGAFARFVTAPARNCLALPDGLEPSIATLGEPLTVAWHATRRGEVGPGIRVLVLGPGTIGQGAAIMARMAGADAVALAGRGDGPRLETAKDLGFDHLFDVATPSGEERLNAFAGTGFDVVIEATGAPAAIVTGLKLLRPRGVFVAAGIHDTLAQVDLTRLVRHQLDIRGSYRAPISAWKPVLNALAEDPSTFAPMITRRMPLDDGISAFELAHGRKELKILLIP